MVEHQCEFFGRSIGCEEVGIYRCYFLKGTKEAGYLCGACLSYFEGSRMRPQALSRRVCSATGSVAAGSVAVEVPAFVIHNVVGSDDEADPVYEGCQKREVVKVPKRNHYELFLMAVKHFMEQQDKCDTVSYTHLTLPTILLV